MTGENEDYKQGYDTGFVAGFKEAERRAALSSPVTQAENTTGLCVKILDTRPNKPFGTWQVIEVLEAIKGFGLIIVEKKDE